jgi:peptide/nickel transport system substrate-binding protein
MGRRVFMWLIAGSLALFTGCARQPSADPDNTLTVTWVLGDLLDAFTDNSPMYLVFLPLVVRNADGELEGRLAERWEHSPDYRSWTVHLRQGIRWHDGVPVTAHDIKFTLDLLTSNRWLYARPGGFTVTVLDDSTYTIEYLNLLADEVGKGSPLDDYTIYYPKHLLEQFDLDDDAYWKSLLSWFTHPVGNGPYRYVGYLPQTMMEFEANPDYYRGKPSIERIVLKSTEARVTELLSGNVDAIENANRRELRALSGNDRFQAYHASTPWHNRVIAWNLRNEFFRDASVRRALTLAIDRAELHQVLHMPAGLPIFDVPLSGGQYWRGEVPEPLPYDPERAKRLLDESGWRDGDGDGVRERDGRPFRFTLLSPSYGPMRGGEDVYIQSQLRLVGIDVEIQTTEWPVVVERVTASEFEAALFGQTASFDSPLGILRYFGEDSFIGYSNSDVVALLNELLSTIDPDEIDRIHRQLAPIFAADLPITILYPGVYTAVAARSVRGLSTPFRADPLRYAEELWLEVP